MNGRAAVVERSWADTMLDDRDDRPLRKQGWEQTIDDMRRRKRLVDCTLPDGFRLATPRPKQVVTEGLLIYSFVLAFDTLGATFHHVQRYEPTVGDDVQMQWALVDFRKELVEAGFDPEDVRLPHPAVAARRRGELSLGGRSKLAGGVDGTRNGVYLGGSAGACRSVARSCRVPLVC